MDNANFMLLDDNAPVYLTTDLSSDVIAKLNRGDELMLDEKFKKNGTNWISVILADGKKGYMAGDTKGSEITLVVLQAANVDVYEAPDATSKVILTYNQGDKIQIIENVNQGDVIWAKTESLTGVVGYIKANANVKEITIATPSNKWPMRAGYIGALLGVAGYAIFFYTYNYHDSDRFNRGIVFIVFFAGFIAGFWLIKVFRMIKRSKEK